MPTEYELQTLEKALLPIGSFFIPIRMQQKLSEVGVVPPPKDVPLPDYAYTLVANVLLNVNS